MFLTTQISKLDVPCYPTSICDSCLKFLLGSYKFYINCSKTNLKLQEVFKEHKNATTFNFPDTKHFKYKLSCPCFKDINQSNKRNSEEVSFRFKKHSDFADIDKAVEINLKVNYSLNNNDSIFHYLQLQKSKQAYWSKTSIIDDGRQEELRTKGFDLNGEVLCQSNSKEENYDYDKELRKAFNFCNSQLPENLKVSLEHRYCKFSFKYVCDICNLSFPEEYLLKPHIEISHIYPNILNSNTAKNQCIECKKNFKTFIALREHLKLQHVWYKCKVCQKQFLGMGKFELHVKKNHSGYRPFQCPICGKLFRTKLLFFEHEKYTHESEKPYKCKICNKKWTKLINLDMHMRTHIGGKLLKCQDCDESFDDADALEQHRKLDHAIKKILHECDLCLAEFTNLGNLTKHMKTHKDYKPYCCVICIRSFPTLRHLKEHISVKHEKQNVLMCELCNRTYLKESDLIAHIEQHAGEM